MTLTVGVVHVEEPAVGGDPVDQIGRAVVREMHETQGVFGPAALRHVVEDGEQQGALVRGHASQAPVEDGLSATARHHQQLAVEWRPAAQDVVGVGEEARIAPRRELVVVLREQHFARHADELRGGVVGRPAVAVGAVRGDAHRQRGQEEVGGDGLARVAPPVCRPAAHGVVRRLMPLVRLAHDDGGPASIVGRNGPRATPAEQDGAPPGSRRLAVQPSSRGRGASPTRGR